MDNSLFSKYERHIKESTDKKDIIIQTIQIHSGLVLSQEEVSLTKKKIKLFISSAKRSRLAQSTAERALKELGYELAY